MESILDITRRVAEQIGVEIEETELPPPPLDENAPKDADYYEDGLLYCGRCHKPKQKRVKLNGVMEIKRAYCDCDEFQISKAKREAWSKHLEEQAELARIAKEQRRDEAFPESSMKAWTFDADDGDNAELSDLAKRYANRFRVVGSEGMGLLLYGTVGTGKTFISACIANSVIDQGFTALVTSFPRLARQSFDAKDGQQKFLDSLNNYDLLVIDDLGVERDTEYMDEVVQSIVDSRYRAKLPLIVTTNLTGEELKHPKSIRNDRVYSRLFEMCYPYEVKGKDRRKLKLKENSKRFKELLGYGEE